LKRESKLQIRQAAIIQDETYKNSVSWDNEGKPFISNTTIETE
jgi:hypothetical protein